MKFIESFFVTAASKKTTNKLFTYDNGALAYTFGAKVLILCGTLWVLLGIPAVVYQDIYWLWVVGTIHMTVGGILIILCKKSMKFQNWAQKDFIKDKKRFLKPSKKRDIIVVIISAVILAVLFGAVFIVAILTK